MRWLNANCSAKASSERLRALSQQTVQFRTVMIGSIELYSTVRSQREVEQEREDVITSPIIRRTAGMRLGYLTLKTPVSPLLTP